jgi:MFS family permease
MSLGDYQHLEIDEELQVDVKGDTDVFSLDGNINASRRHSSQSITLSHASNSSLSSLGISTPSDPARRWAVFLFSVTTILLYADQNLLGPNLSAVASEFGFSDEERDRKLGGDIALAFFLLGAPASLVVGCLADTSHRSRLFAMVVGIGEGACLLTYFSTTYSQLYVCRAITGFSVGGALPLIYSVLGDLFASDERHAVSAVVGVGTGAGIALGQGVAGFLGPTFGWRLPFLIVSVPALVCALLVLLTVTDPERGGMERAAVERREISDGSLKAHNSRQTLLSDNKEKESRTYYIVENECRAPTMKGSNSKLSIDQHQVVKQDQIVDVYLDSIYDLGTPKGFDIRVHWRTFVSLMSTPSVVLCLLQGAPGCVPWVSQHTLFSWLVAARKLNSIDLTLNNRELSTHISMITYPRTRVCLLRVLPQLCCVLVLDHFVAC